MSRKWRLVFASMLIVGVAIFLAGIFLSPEHPVVYVVGMVVIALGLNLSIASRYKARTGKDHPGAKFWKRVFGIKNDAQ